MYLVVDFLKHGILIISSEGKTEVFCDEQFVGLSNTAIEWNLDQIHFNNFQGSSLEEES